MKFNKDSFKSELGERLRSKIEEKNLVIEAWEKAEWKLKKDGTEFSNPKLAAVNCKFYVEFGSNKLSVDYYDQNGRYKGNDVLYLLDCEICKEAIGKKIAKVIECRKAEMETAKRILSNIDKTVDEFGDKVDEINEFMKAAALCEKDKDGGYVHAYGNMWYTLFCKELERYC